VKIDISKSQIYTIGNLSKSDAGNLLIQNEIVCGGNLTLSGGHSTVTESYGGVNYSITCVGNVSLADGESRSYLIYGGGINLHDTSTSKWNNHDYTYANSSIIPNVIEAHDLVGYSKYLMTMLSKGVVEYSNAQYTLTGRNSKSLNIFDIDSANCSTMESIRIVVPNGATSVIRVSSTSELNINHLISIIHQNTKGKVLIVIDTPTLNITNSNIDASIFAVNSNTAITNSTFKGSIFTSSLNLVGDNTFNAEYFDAYIPDAVAPVISVLPLSSLGNYDAVPAYIHSENSIPPYYEVKYTLDGSTPTRNSNNYPVMESEINVYGYGNVVLTAMIFGNGVSDGKKASQSYGFLCKCQDPVLVTPPITPPDIYLIEHDPNDTVYFTVDGSDPTVYSNKYDEGTFSSYFDYEGFVNIKMAAFSDRCEPSNIIMESVFIESPSKTAIPRCRLLNKDGVAVPVNIEDIDHKGTVCTTTQSYSLDDIGKMTVKVDNYLGNLKYSINGDNPVSNGVYNIGSSLVIPFITLGYNPIRAYAFEPDKEFSKQITFFFDVKMSDEVNFSGNIIDLDFKSEQVLDSMQSSSSYAMDIAWIGPGVITDDTAVYQALVNILATEMFERIFNPTFGVSIMNQLAEIHLDTSSASIVNTLKAEVEIQDSRIIIDENRSIAVFDDSIEALVVHIYWINRITGNEAYLKYAYNVDIAY